jgi:hypothetical protein
VSAAHDCKDILRTGCFLPVCRRGRCRRISSFPYGTLPARNGAGKAYSHRVVGPKSKFCEPRPTRSSDLTATEREAYDEREREERKHETSGRPNGSVMSTLAAMFEAATSVRDVTICATDEVVRSAAPATARSGPGDGVAPAGRSPPRPAPPNPYWISSSSSAGMAGATSLFLPLALPLPRPLPLAGAAGGVPFSASMLM